MRAEYAEAARRSRSTKDRRRRERRDCSKKLGSDRASSLRQFVSLWCQLRPNEYGCDHDQHPDAGKHPTAVMEFRSGERDTADNNALPDRRPENRKTQRINSGIRERNQIERTPQQILEFLEKGHHAPRVTNNNIHTAQQFPQLQV